MARGNESRSLGDSPESIYSVIICSHHRLPIAGICFALALAAADAHAQALAAPVAPDTIARDATGERAIVRCVKLPAPLKLDGHLDESIDLEARPISDFIQLEPRNGEPATEKTDVWLAFDAENIYVSMRVWESRPERMVVNEMRRDSNNIRLGESIWFALDTFHDRRNAYQFEVNPLGGRTDAVRSSCMPCR